MKEKGEEEREVVEGVDKPIEVSWAKVAWAEAREEDKAAAGWPSRHAVKRPKGGRPAWEAPPPRLFLPRGGHRKKGRKLPRLLSYSARGQTRRTSLTV